MLKTLFAAGSFATLLTTHIKTTSATQVWVGSGGISTKDASATCNSWQEFSCNNDICDSCAGSATNGRCRNGGNSKGTCPAGTLCSTPTKGHCLENTICAPGRHSMPDKTVGTPKHFQCIHVDQIDKCNPVIAYENHDCTGASCFIAQNGHYATSGGQGAFWNCIDTAPADTVNTVPCRSAGEGTGQGTMPPGGGGFPLLVPMAVAGAAGMPGLPQGSCAGSSSSAGVVVPVSSSSSLVISSSISSTTSSVVASSTEVTPSSSSITSSSTSSSASSSSSSSSLPEYASSSASASVSLAPFGQPASHSSTPIYPRLTSSVPRHTPIPSFGTGSSTYGCGTGIYPSSSTPASIPIHGPYLPSSSSSTSEWSMAYDNPEPYQPSSTSSTKTTSTEQGYYSNPTTSSQPVYYNPPGLPSSSSAEPSQPHGYLPPNPKPKSLTASKKHHTSSEPDYQEPQSYGPLPPKPSTTHHHHTSTTKHHPKHPHHTSARKEKTVTETTTEIDYYVKPCPSSSKHY